MRLYEISKLGMIDQPNIDFGDVGISKAPQVASVLNKPILKLDAPTGDTFYIVVDENTKEVMAWVNGTHQQIGDSDVFSIYRSYCVPQHRNKGLVTNLYKTLYKSLRMVLVSDSQHSIESVSVWRKLWSSGLPVKLLDPTTGTTTAISDFDDAYKDPETRLVMEMTLIESKYTPIHNFKIGDKQTFPVTDHKGLL